MSYRTGLFILIAAVCLVGLLYILPTIATLLWYFVLFLLIGSALSLIGFAILSGLIAKEKYLTTKADRTAKEYDAKAAKYRDYQDGFGMTHLLNLETNIVENLTIYPGSHHNGKWEEPPAQAVAAWHAAISRNKQVTEQVIKQLPSPIQNNSLEILPILDKAERVLIKGASDAGKTTLLQHIASRSLNPVIIDPHNKPGQWPSNSKIIGDGYNFGEVASFLDYLASEIESRYKRRAKGDENYNPFTVIIDEFGTVKEECENTKYILSKAIRECRKIKIRLFVGSHSELVKPLGLEGASDIKDGLLIVRLEVDQITKERSSTIDYGRGERLCYFPAYGVMPDLIIPPSKDDKIISLIQSGATDKEIAQEVFSKSYLSGDNFYKVKELREKYG